jgi:hypothetical protein
VVAKICGSKVGSGLAPRKRFRPTACGGRLLAAVPPVLAAKNINSRLCFLGEKMKKQTKKNEEK